MTILVVAAVLAGATTVIFSVLIIGIRRGDRSHLSNSPRSGSEAFARRVLVGVRYCRGSNKGGGQ